MTERESERFARLLNAQRPALLAQARSLAHGRAQTPEDLVQEAVVRAWIARETFRGDPTVEAHLRGWLFKILVNIHIDDGKRRRGSASCADVEISALPYPDNVLPEVSGPEEALFAHALGEGLDLAIRSLPCRSRTVLLESAEGASYEEIARKLGMPLGTVRSRLHRARCRVRERLER